MPSTWEVDLAEPTSKVVKRWIHSELRGTLPDSTEDRRHSPDRPFSPRQDALSKQQREGWMEDPHVRWQEWLRELLKPSAKTWETAPDELAGDMRLRSAQESELLEVAAELCASLKNAAPASRRKRVLALLEAVRCGDIDERRALYVFEIAHRFGVVEALPVILDFLRRDPLSDMHAYCLSFARQFKLDDGHKAAIREVAFSVSKRLRDAWQSRPQDLPADMQSLLVNLLRTLVVASPRDAVLESLPWLSMNPVIYQVLDTMCSALLETEQVQGIDANLKEFRAAVAKLDGGASADAPALAALVTEALLLSGGGWMEALEALDRLPYATRSYFLLTQGRIAGLNPDTLRRIFARAFMALKRDGYQESLRLALARFAKIAPSQVLDMCTLAPE